MNTKTIVVVTVVVLLVLGGGIYYWLRGAGSSPAPESEGAAMPSEDATSTVAATATAPTPKKPIASSPTLTYAEAVTLFGGRRIQFNKDCGMEPSSITFKNGTSVMLDNRGPARTIALDDIEYQIGAFGFKILTLRSRALPHTVRVDCGDGVNNGQIILQ